MDKTTFDNLLNTRDITWNNVVTITVRNPHYKWWYFGINEFVKFSGALDYFDDDDKVILCSEKFDNRFQFTEKWGSAFYSFNFNEIVNIKKEII